MLFNDVRLQYELLSQDIAVAVREVLASGRYILGPEVAAFEREFAAYIGTSEGIGVASGMDALVIALRAAGIRAGDEVLVPAISAAATAMAVTSAGARPVFVDVSLEDFNIDPVQALSRKTPQTRAIVPVHLYGMPARLDELKQLGVAIIEDAAQAHGSEAEWGRCGTFGLASAFSFYPTKNLGTYGDGGMIVTADAEVARMSRLLRNYGQQADYSSDILGVNSRLDELHAAILRVKLRKLDEWNARRRAIAARYREAFRNLPIGIQKVTGTSNYHLFVITTPDRRKVRSRLEEAGIPSLIHYPVPLHRQKAFAEFDPAACPNADVLCAQVLSLPMHAFLTDDEVDRVIDAVCRCGL